MDKLSSLFFEDSEDDDIQIPSLVTDEACVPDDDPRAQGRRLGLLVSDGPKECARFSEEDSSLGWVGFFCNADVDLVLRAYVYPP